MAGLTVKIKAEDVTSVSISKYKDGYNYASVHARPSAKGSEKACNCVTEESSDCGCDKEYISVNYEWQGDSIPDIVMDIMSFVQKEKAAINISIEEKAEEWAAYQKKSGNKNKKC